MDAQLKNFDSILLSVGVDQDLASSAVILAWIARADDSGNAQKLAAVRQFAAKFKLENHVEQLIGLTDPSSISCLQLACALLRSRLVQNQKESLLELACRIAAVDGYVSISEHVILRFLSGLFGYTARDFDMIAERSIGFSPAPLGDPSSLRWWAKIEAKDLYKRTGINPTASAEVIRQLLASQPDSEDRAAATQILQVEHRRRVYDRVRETYVTLGAVAANLRMSADIPEDFRQPLSAFGAQIPRYLKRYHRKSPRRNRAVLALSLILGAVVIIALASRFHKSSNYTPQASIPPPSQTVPKDREPPTPEFPTPLRFQALFPPPEIAPEGLVGSGTGFFVGKQGWILTCNHGINDADQVKVVISNGETLLAAVVDKDAKHDLALLRVQREAPAVVPVLLDQSFLDQSAALGDEIYTLGFPDPELEGFNPKLTSGIINSRTGPADDPDYLQISAAVQPGNSGGAVIAEQGYLVGIVSGKLKEGVFLKETDVLPQNLNYASKASLARTLLEDQNVALETTVFQTKKEAIPNLEKATVLILVYRSSESSRQSPAEPVRTPTPTPFDKPAKPLPDSGIFWAFSSQPRMAPFKITTQSGSRYYIKLVDAYSKAPAITIFVDGAQTIQVDVPLGTFEVRWASGWLWYGSKSLFGPKTRCTKGMHLLTFTQDGNYVTGQHVTLYIVPNGNFETAPIDISEF